MSAFIVAAVVSLFVAVGFQILSLFFDSDEDVRDLEKCASWMLISAFVWLFLEWLWRAL